VRGDIVSRRGVDAWRREVYQSPRISDATRVLLLLMAEHMDRDRKVCVKRVELARELQRHEQRISERIGAAHKAGYLTTVSPGYRGHTAVYEGLFPDPVSVGKVTDPEDALGAPQRYPIPPVMRTAPLDTTTRADPSERGTDRNVGNYEKQAVPDVAVDELLSRQRREATG
jgi:hypothetical protein